MANILDRFLNSMKLYDDDDDDDDEDYDVEETPAPPKRSAARKQTVREEEEPAAPRREPKDPIRSARRPSRDNVLPMKNGGMEVCMIRPTALEDAREVCDILLSGRAVVINMEGVHVDLAQRIIDFTSGSVFSINGNLQKISKYIFIVSPQNIGLTGDFSEVIENNQELSSLNLNL